MKHATKYLGLLILLTILRCAPPDIDSYDMILAEEEEYQTFVPITEQITDQITERKLIKEGNVEFETQNIKSTRKSVFEAVDKYRGYVSSDKEYVTQDRKSITVVIRVPAISFDNFLKDATLGVSKFESKEIDVKDVTEDFLDIQARLKNKKELENRYLDILKQARTAIEILEIEKQIGLLRSDIESTEGRLKYLQSQISFSTLTITFYESVPRHTEFGNKFKNGFGNGWNNLVLFFIGLINIWPFLLIALALIFGIRIYKKRK